MPRNVNIKCQYCHGPGRTSTHDLQRGYGRFCSRSCGAKGSAADRKKDIKLPETSSEGLYIPLSRGQYTIIDTGDSDLLDDLWYLGRGGYAVRMDDLVSGRQHWLHKLILTRVLGRDLSSDEFADHKNRNRLDNRRENLRLATRAQNNANRKSARRSTSQFLGVCWHKRQEQWAATLRTDKRQIHIGYYANEAEAAWMYDQWALQIHGDFANPNFEYV